MRKSNDKTLSLMVHTAGEPDSPSPARVALLQSIIFWSKYDFLEGDQKLFFFIHLTANPDYFDLPNYRIAQELHISQKCVQKYRSEFKQLFRRDFARLQNAEGNTLSLIHSVCCWELEALGFSSSLSPSPKTLTSRALRYFKSAYPQSEKLG